MDTEKVRRKDQEINAFDQIIKIMEQCSVCRVAFHGDEYPYVIPMNFGMAVEGEQVMLYLHGARAGKKLELLRANPKVCIEIDREGELIIDEPGGDVGVAYESVIGYGVMEVLTSEEERLEGLRVLSAHYPEIPEGFVYNAASIRAANVFRITVTALSGKRREH